MEVIQYIELLHDLVESSAKVPITGKVMLDKKEILDIIDKIMNLLPDELKKAQWVLGEKERILNEATQQFDAVKKETMDIMQKQIENHDVVKEAKVSAQEVMTAAQRDAKAIRLGARDYADEMLCQLNKEIETKGEAMIIEMKKHMDGFLNDLVGDVKNTTGTIRDNIKELRNMK